MINAIIGLVEVVGKAALKVGGKAAIAGAKKIAMKTAPQSVKIATQKKAEAQAIAAAKYKAALLSSHGIPAKHVIVKTKAGKAVYVVTHAKPVIIQNGIGKVMLTLEATGKGFMVKATPLATAAAKAGAAKSVLVGVGKAIAVGGAVILGIIGGGSL